MAGCLAAKKGDTAALGKQQQQQHISGCVGKGCMCVPHGPEVDQGKDSSPRVTIEATKGNHPEA